MPKYWVYSHNEDGDILKDIISTNELWIAFQELYTHTFDDVTAYRITELDQFGSYNTIWYAGPIAWLNHD